MTREAESAGTSAPLSAQETAWSAIERDFQREVFGDNAPDASHALAGQLTFATRMRVYRDGFPARIRDALRETYPAVDHCLGEELFDRLAWDYAAQSRPRAYDLGAAALGLPEFVESHPARHEYPALADLARLERAVSESFHAERWDAPHPRHCGAENVAARFAQIDADTGEATDPATVEFCRQNHLRVLRSDWALGDAWRAFNAGSAFDLAQCARRPGAAWNISRTADFHVLVREVGAAESYFWEALGAVPRALGEALAQVEERLAERDAALANGAAGNANAGANIEVHNDAGEVADPAQWLSEGCEECLLAWPADRG